MQSVDAIDYGGAQVKAVSQEAASASVVNKAERRFWSSRRLAVAAANNQLSSQGWLSIHA